MSSNYFSYRVFILGIDILGIDIFISAGDFYLGIDILSIDIFIAAGGFLFLAKFLARLAKFLATFRFYSN